MPERTAFTGIIGRAAAVGSLSTAGRKSSTLTAMTPERLVMLTEIRTSVSNDTATSVWRFHTTLFGGRSETVIWPAICRGLDNHFHCACICHTYTLALRWPSVFVIRYGACMHPRLHASLQRVISDSPLQSAEIPCIWRHPWRPLDMPTCTCHHLHSAKLN